MKKTKLYLMMAFGLIVFSIITSCGGDEDPVIDLPPAELLQGYWKCETTDGTWDILRFKSIDELDWQYIDANKQTITNEYTFVADGTNVFLTNKNDNSKSAHKYSINRDELTFQYFTGDDYLYFKLED